MQNIKFLDPGRAPQIRRGAEIKQVWHNGRPQTAKVISIHPSGMIVLRFPDGETCAAMVSED